MAQKLTDITDAFDAFVKSLDENRFYDAHEDLEHIWFPRRFEESEEVKLWKGFINAAVYFELIKKGRGATSGKVWESYLKYKPLLQTLHSEHNELYAKIVDIIESKKDELCQNF